MEFEPFRRVVEARIGKERYNSLWERHNQINKYKDFDLMELIDLFKAKIDKLAPGFSM